MSYKNYVDALTILENDYDYISANGAIELKLIKQLEAKFNFKFSPQYFNYLKEYGFISFNNKFVFGISPTTLTDNKKNNILLNYDHLIVNHSLNKKYLPIYLNNDLLYVQDYVNISTEEEPLIYEINTKTSEQKQIATDFGDFLLKLVTDKII